jgi:hypothetical protein
VGKREGRGNDKYLHLHPSYINVEIQLISQEANGCSTTLS